MTVLFAGGWGELHFQGVGGTAQALFKAPWKRKESAI